MVFIAVSKMGMAELSFVDSGMKVNGQYYCDALLSQQMLPANKHVAGDMFVFQQDNAPSHYAKDTIKLLQQETPDFIGPDLLPLNSPDLNQVDYKVWSVMQQTVNEVVWTVSMSWSSASLKSGTVCSIINVAITSGENDWERACVQTDNILNIYCEHVWLTKVMDK